MKSAAGHVVLYDGECPLCRFQMRLISRLDWFGVFRLVPNQDPCAIEAAPTVTLEELNESIHCVAADGRVYHSARCFRFICLRLPLMVPIALILWIPGVLRLAERFYPVISRNRYRISRWFGCQGVCVIPARTQNLSGKSIGIKDAKSGSLKQES